MSIPTPEAVALAPAERFGWLGTGRRWLGALNLELVIPAAFIALIVAACFLAPALGLVAGPLDAKLADALTPPLSEGYLLGTDPIGRDILSRILHGGQTSLQIAFSTIAIGMAVGAAIGMTAGLKGGRLDTVIMRVLDALLAFPSLILLMVIATYLGPSKLNLILAISFFTIPDFSRLARAGTLRLRERVFINAARLSGQNDRTILVRHVAPNVLPQLMTYSLLQLGHVIVLEATLSFLGLGVPAPAPTWGNMISTGQAYLSTNPELVLIPSAFLLATVLSLNVLGDALRSRWGSI